jgi:ribosome-associated heat shock protein Hsp15
MAESGRVRINRQPTDKPHARVRVGDVLTLPLHAGVRVVEVLGLSELYRQIAEDEVADVR